MASDGERSGPFRIASIAIKSMEGSGQDRRQDLDALPSNNEIVRRMVSQFEKRAIRVNLSGLRQREEHGGDVDRAIASILREPLTTTEREIAHAVGNVKFFSKAKFYLNRQEVIANRDAVIRLINGH